MGSMLAQTQPQSVVDPWLDKFVGLYQKLDKSNLELLQELYHQDIVFVDPMHRIEGLDNLKDYFANLYENLTECQFNIEHSVHDNDSASLYWQMVFSHKRLAAGKAITVDGHTVLKMHQGKVIYHRDYFDTAAMLYEQIPLLGGIIRYIKNRIA